MPSEYIGRIATDTQARSLFYTHHFRYIGVNFRLWSEPTVTKRPNQCIYALSLKV